MRLNDALLCGAPLVVSRGMGGVQLIDRYGCGLAVRQCDPVAMANALEKLARDGSLYRHVAEKAIAAAQACDPEKKAHELLRLIKEMDDEFV